MRSAITSAVLRSLRAGTTCSPAAESTALRAFSSQSGPITATLFPGDGEQCCKTQAGRNPPGAWG